MRPTDLDGLLVAARDADPSDRIELRDLLAAHGENAVEAMTDWLGDPRLAAFAVRVLEVIGRKPETRDAVIEVLTAVDRAELAPHHAGDVDRALAALGWSNPALRSTSRGRRTGSSIRSVGKPGVAGRGYWVMRTSQWERPFIWAEASRGRLRQGWGWTREMDLDMIAERLRLGGELDEAQRISWRSRRMRTSDADGMRVGDIVLGANLPAWGSFSIFRVSGPYRYEMTSPHGIERFGHILPVELLLAGIDRRSSKVSDGLRTMLRPQTRLYNITDYGGDVELVLGNELPALPTTGTREGEVWTERDYELLFGRFPPSGEHPTRDQIAALASELGRTYDGVDWQWRDGQAYCTGGSASTTSNALKSWLGLQFADRSNGSSDVQASQPQGGPWTSKRS